MIQQIYAASRQPAQQADGIVFGIAPPNSKGPLLVNRVKEKAEAGGANHRASRGLSPLHTFLKPGSNAGEGAGKDRESGEKRFPSPLNAGRSADWEAQELQPSDEHRGRGGKSSGNGGGGEPEEMGFRKKTRHRLNTLSGGLGTKRNKRKEDNPDRYG